MKKSFDLLILAALSWLAVLVLGYFLLEGLGLI